MTGFSVGGIAKPGSMIGQMLTGDESCEAKVFIGKALVEEKGAIGEGCLPTLLHQLQVDEAPFALNQRKWVAELNDPLAVLEREDVEPRPGPPRHDCQPKDAIVFQPAGIAAPLTRLTPCSASAA
ncbi:MAG: hypothetical protein ACKVK6_03815 [bacterium]